ncbi:hypothetical protein OIE52_13725 [Streptomyces canus]|uniref:hypothetical protein n=1 Tax=Streptomyces canus TaxID=58343 RepID=UPI0032565F8D
MPKSTAAAKANISFVPSVVGGPRPIAVATPLPGALPVGNRLFVRRPGAGCPAGFRQAPVSNLTGPSYRSATVAAMTNPSYRSRPVPGRSARAALFTAVGTTGLVVLTACGGGGSGSGSDRSSAGDSDVASIASPSKAVGTPKRTTDPDAGRPVIRLDSSTEETNRMWDSWYACLRAKGGPLKGAPTTPAEKAGAKACASKQPITPPELDPATNPDYSDDLRAWVECLNAHGVKVTMVGSSDYSFDQSQNTPHFNEIDTACQVKAFQK